MKNLFFFLSLFIFTACSKSSTEDAHRFDTILNQIKSLKSDSLKKSQKKEKLEQIVADIKEFRNDSLRTIIYSKVARQYMRWGDSVKFRQFNTLAMQLAKKRDDSSAIGRAYWDLGSFFSRLNLMDSAYSNFQKAEKIYALSRDGVHQAGVLINIGKIQIDIKDLLGAEATTYKALKLLEDQPTKTNALHNVYNNLGVIYFENGNYEKALYFYHKAESTLGKEGIDNRYPTIWNNIGSILSQIKKYKEGRQYFEKTLKLYPNLSKEHPTLYAIVLSNLTENKIAIGDSAQSFANYQKALSYARIEGDPIANTSIHLNLVKYFLLKRDTMAAIKQALAAKKVGEKGQENKGRLEALSQLLTIDRKNTSKYAIQYVKLNDSLHQQERKTQDKFASIRYETGNYIARTKVLSNRLYWVIGASAGTVLIMAFFITIFRQRSKNKELLLNQQQQEANQKVYKLIVKHEKKYQEGRELEKRKIGRELHDGILGKLFGIQLNLESLNEKNDTISREKRYQYIDQIREVGNDLRNLSHQLSKIKITQLSFASVIEDYITSQETETTHFSLEVDHNVSFDYIDDEEKVNIFRIIQECIQNIHKHANATESIIRIRQTEEFMEISIEDNGRGTGEGESKTGIGIQNMQARAKEMGGKIWFEFGKLHEKNTKIILQIPLQYHR